MRTTSRSAIAPKSAECELVYLHMHQKGANTNVSPFERVASTLGYLLGQRSS